MKMEQFQIGDRVILRGEDIGHVEEDLEDGYYEVRLLTPKNEPSILSSICYHTDMMKVPEHVVPAPKSKEWYRQSDEFYNRIASFLHVFDNEE